MVTRKRTPRKTTEEIENTVTEEVETVEEAVEKKEVKPKTTRAKKVEKNEPTTEELMKQIAELQKALTESKAEPVKEVKPANRRIRQALPDIPLTDRIPVVSRTEGSLFYKSTKTQQETTWSEYGELQYLTYEELLNMKSTQKGFIYDALVVIEDEEVEEALGLTALYDKIFHIDNIDSYILNTKLDDLKKEILGLPRGLKTSIGVAAKKLIDNNELDSRGKILMLEETLKIKLDNF